MPVNIHGKQYKTVAERLNELNSDEVKYSLVTVPVTYFPVKQDKSNSFTLEPLVIDFKKFKNTFSKSLRSLGCFFIIILISLKIFSQLGLILY